MVDNNVVDDTKIMTEMMVEDVPIKWLNTLLFFYDFF